MVSCLICTRRLTDDCILDGCNPGGLPRMISICTDLHAYVYRIRHHDDHNFKNKARWFPWQFSGIAGDIF